MKLLIAAAALALTAPADEHAHRHVSDPQLGTLSFETSCKAEADALFQRGLRWLHSFEYEEAARTFVPAASLDPGCGIARWPRVTSS